LPPGTWPDTANGLHVTLSRNHNHLQWLLRTLCTKRWWCTRQIARAEFDGAIILTRFFLANSSLWGHRVHRRERRRTGRAAKEAPAKESPANRVANSSERAGEAPAETRCGVRDDARSALSVLRHQLTDQSFQQLRDCLAVRTDVGRQGVFQGQGHVDPTEADDF
jgi:hypothetical protein